MKNGSKNMIFMVWGRFRSWYIHHHSHWVLGLILYGIDMASMTRWSFGVTPPHFGVTLNTCEHLHEVPMDTVPKSPCKPYGTNMVWSEVWNHEKRSKTVKKAFFGSKALEIYPQNIWNRRKCPKMACAPRNRGSWSKCAKMDHFRIVPRFRGAYGI